MQGLLFSILINRALPEEDLIKQVVSRQGAKTPRKHYECNHQHVGWAKERSDVPIKIQRRDDGHGLSGLCPSYRFFAMIEMTWRSWRLGGQTD
ncbi:MAG TPA: hypothetical protein ENJ01_13005 [Gammaproteobacteria bacterium]|nr:hypothetical protein [Gammaproteobacteria bacterium]